MRRPSLARLLSSALAALFLILAAGAGPVGAQEAEAPRRLALLALIDNDSGDTLPGDLAEGVGDLVTRSLAITGRYARVRTLVGRRATRDNFFRELHALLRADYVVDIVLETHGLPEVLAVHGGRLTGRDIVAELDGKGGEKIRLVYMMGCYSASLVDDWMRVGADAVTGHVGLNVVPVFHFPTFLRLWAQGTDARTATERAYEISRRRARSGWYRALGRIFQGAKITEKDIDQGSVTVFAGRTVTIDAIPTRAEELAWLEERRAEDRVMAEIDRLIDERLGALDRESLRAMIRAATR